MKTLYTQRRAMPELNASSMADIAFLLLAFFLVTTVIDTEKGIGVKLPPIVESPPTDISDRNVFSVKINYENQLLIEGELSPISKLRERTKDFIRNPSHRPDLSSSPTAAVISLQNDRSTNYRTYVTVYNELKAAYNELWNEEAYRSYGSDYANLSRSRQKSVRDRIPLVISENDMVDYAAGKN